MQIESDWKALQFEYEPGCLPRRRTPRSRTGRRAKKPASSVSEQSASISAGPITFSGTNKTTEKKLSLSNTIKDRSSLCTNPVAAGTPLPAGRSQGPHRRRYVWDGTHLRAVELQEVDAAVADARERASHRSNRLRLPSLGAVRGAMARWVHDTHAAFFPNPDSVTPVFATQSLLLAVGVGARRSLPAAAGINWVLKDGLGRLGRLTVATRFGESFDSDLKRFRYSSSMLYAASLALDFLTPVMPQHFLPMAAAANVGKSVGLTTYISTQPAFQRSFARSENLADISAKAQAQQMAIDTVGLAVAVTLSALCARRGEALRRALPLAAFPVLVTGDLYSIYRELRSIHLRTLNKERAEIIAAAWLESGSVLTPEQVSAKERLVLPPELATSILPLSIGDLEHALRCDSDVAAFLRQGPQRKTVVSMVPPSGGVLLGSCESGKRHQLGPIGEGLKTLVAWGVSLAQGGPAPWQGAVHAALRKDATSYEVLEIVLCTARMRQRMAVDRNAALGPLGLGVFQNADARVGWVEDARREVARHVPRFVQELEAAGWQVSPFMLSSTEKRRYIYL